MHVVWAAQLVHQQGVFYDGQARGGTKECLLNGYMWFRGDASYIIKEFLTTGRTGLVQYM